MLVVVLHPLLFLWCCSSFIAVFVMLVVVLHSLLFGVISHPSASYRQEFTPILYFQPSSSQSDLRHFHFSLSGPFFRSFTASATILSGYLLPTGVFYLTFLPHIFATTCFYQGLPGSRQFFLEVCRASCWSSKRRPRPSVCLIHSNPQSWYSQEFVFKLYQILSWITCGKKFSLSAPYLFQTLLACSQSYVKNIKTTLNKTCTAYNRFDETAHRSYFEEAVTRKAAKRHIK